MYQREYYQSHKEISKERVREYQRRPDVKIHRQQTDKVYRQRPDVKARTQQYMKAYCHTPEYKGTKRFYSRRPDVKAHKQKYSKEYNQNHPELKEKRQQYRQTSAGRLACIRAAAKHRTKGFNLLCPNFWTCPVDYHHVSPNYPYVVPLPRVVHQSVTGRSNFHFVFNAAMISQLYELDLGQRG